MGYLKGIDVSEHQGVIDWEKVKGQIDYAILRVGFGKNHIDRQFVRNAQECTRLGIPFGVYWFSYAKTVQEAKNEAAFCLAAIKPYKIDFPVCYDFEYDSVSNAKLVNVTVTKELATSMANAFLYDVEEAGYFAVNYTNVDYLKRYFSADLSARFGVWLAAWPKAVNPNKPPMSCLMWQWGGTTYAGISGNVDSNFCYRAFGVKQADKPAEQPPAPVDDWQRAAVQNALNNGLLTDAGWLDKYAQPATVGMVCEIANRLKGVH